MDDPRQPQIWRWRPGDGVATLLLCALMLSFGNGFAEAAEFTKRFDRGKPSWQLQRDPSGVRLVYHRIDADRRIRDSAAESIRVNVLRRSSAVVWQHRLPTAQVIEDLKAKLWMRSSRVGVSVSLRVMLPRHINPKTREPLFVDILGANYEKAGKWQQLTCAIDERRLQSKVRLLRARLSNPQISSAGRYVDRIIVTADWDPGIAEVNFHSLRFGPIVSPREPQPAPRGEIQLAGHSQSQQRFELPFEFRMDRLLVEGKPFFPRIVAYHNESLEELKDAGVNVVWVPRIDQPELLAGLRRRGMWATATPPRIVPNRGNKKASLLPVSRFGMETAPILFWTVGARIPATAQKSVIRWLDDVRRADAGIDRPVMGDVLGSERVFSRHISMLGVSRHMINTGMSFKQYRNWLLQRRKMARPGSFLWTWIQTEPSSADKKFRKAAGLPPIVIEPEQIRQQFYAAIAAGCRGVGFWKSSRLDGEMPGAKERRWAISQLNLEADLLAPLLSTGTVSSQIPFSVQLSSSKTIGQRRLDFRSSPRERAQREALVRARSERRNQKARLAGELEATVIRSEHGMLLLPIWYQTFAQFSPGKMAGVNASIVVPGVSESALVWEVTTTGIRSLVREPVPGGIRITIPTLDQTTAVILTSNRKLIDDLRRKIQRTGMAAKSARFSVNLAAEKLTRVKQINEQLAQLGIRQPDARQLLAKAAYFVKNAEDSLKRREYHAARQLARTSMQLQRILQRAHWDHAVQSLAMPVSSPHAISFQTLPEHWKMMRALNPVKDDATANLLRSGDFEDFDTMVAMGWKHRQGEVDGVRAAAELYPTGRKSAYALRLVAVPERGRAAPRALEQPPVVVTTPAMTVRSGQIVRVSGWVRVVSPVIATFDGLMIYDSIAGPGSALRYGAKSGWQKFSLLRRVPRSGSFQMTFSLTGLGEVQLDGVEVVAYQPGSRPKTTPSKPVPAETGNWTKPLEFFRNLPRIPGIPGLSNGR